MKILVVSNLYPPHFIGGYELGCRDMVEGLRARGHTVRVLAGDFKNSTAPEAEEPGVDRVLQFRSQGSGGLRSHFDECRKLRSILRSFSPELIYFWNLGGLCPWLPLAARRDGCRIVFFLFDTNFVSWRVGAWLGKLASRNALVRRLFGATFLVQGWPVLRHQPCHFGSDFLRRTAVEADMKFDEKSSIVVRWGIDSTPFTAAAPPRVRWPVRRLLYVGQMSPLKGIHTAIAALGELARQGLADLRLTIVGGGNNPDYEQTLRTSVQTLGLTGQVVFRGKVAPAALPGVYAENDLLIFPSEWAEPFGITRLEAMASGLAVVGTTTGGSGELLRDRDTALTFQAGDVADCARALGAACRDRDLFEAVRSRGQEEVLTQYTLDRMIQQVEASLRTLVAAR